MFMIASLPNSTCIASMIHRLAVPKLKKIITRGLCRFTLKKNYRNKSCLFFEDVICIISEPSYVMVTPNVKSSMLACY